MLLIPGILASSYFAPQGDFESIATVTVGSGGQANVEFTNIPQTYQHLQIRGFHRNTATNNQGYILLGQLNGDTATNYSWHLLRGNGSAASASAAANESYMLLGYQLASATATLGHGAFVCDILDYTNNNKYTTIRSLGGADLNDPGIIDFYSGNWRNTNAVTSIKLYYAANNVAQNTQIALYGIKG